MMSTSIDLIECLSRRVWLWTQMHQLDQHPDYRDVTLQFKSEQRAKGYTFMCSSMRVLRHETQMFLLNVKTEQQILTERLARRYDPGLAMSEAFARASAKLAEGRLQQASPTTPPSADPVIRQHYDAMRRRPVELTPQQRAALELQQKTLRKNLERPDG